MPATSTPIWLWRAAALWRAGTAETAVVASKASEASRAKRRMADPGLLWWNRTANRHFAAGRLAPVRPRPSSHRQATRLGGPEPNEGSRMSQGLVNALQYYGAVAGA